MREWHIKSRPDSTATKNRDLCVSSRQVDILEDDKILSYEKSATEGEKNQQSNQILDSDIWREEKTESHSMMQSQQKKIISRIF